MPNLTVRAAESRADRELSVRIYDEVLPQRAVTLEDVDSYLGSMEHTSNLLAYLGDEPVGSAHAGREGGKDVPFAQVYVLRAHRRHGAGSKLYSALSEWARSIGAERIRSEVEEADEESLAWARRRGFEERGRDSLMRLELEGYEPPRSERPAGVEIVTWAERPELVHGMYEVYREAEPDIPGERHEPIPPFEDWLCEDMSGSGDRPEWTFVAVAGDEVVGYSKFSLTEARPDVAFHDLTGVKRAWRGRGIARALKATQIAWAKEHGYRRVETYNEERNEPIRRLNVEFGYRPAPGRVSLVGPLAP